MYDLQRVCDVTKPERAGRYIAYIKMALVDTGAVYLYNAHREKLDHCVSQPATHSRCLSP